MNDEFNVRKELPISSCFYHYHLCITLLSFQGSSTFYKCFQLKTEKKCLSCGYPYFSYDERRIFELKPSSHEKDLELWNVSLYCNIIFQINS